MSVWSPIIDGVDETDAVFRALNDRSRRLLLDELFERDGQTLSELCQHLPNMTRFGVMNHLKVLAEGRLVTTTRVGRARHHYLNPVPIRRIHDRWIDKFTAPMARTLSDLTTELERGGSTMTTNKPIHVYETYVRCRPKDIWQALVDGDQTVRYYYGTRVESEWSPGATIRYLGPDGTTVADGEVIVADEPDRLEMLFHARWDPELEAEGPVHMVWLIEPVDGPEPGRGALSKVRVEYHDVDPDGRTHQDFAGGIPFIVAGLKTLLETGDPLASSA